MPGVRFSGLGGPEMQAAGCDCLYQLTDLAVMGFGQVIPLIGEFYRVYRRARDFLRREHPDAVVLVDFPGFNWWIAAAAKKQGIPVYYYCPPQLWAWAPWRIRKVRKFVDCVLSVLPFEAEWFRARDVDVSYVGHPFFDDVAAHELDSEFLTSIRKDAPFNSGALTGARGSRKSSATFR